MNYVVSSAYMINYYNKTYILSQSTLVEHSVCFDRLMKLKV